MAHQVTVPAAGPGYLSLIPEGHTVGKRELTPQSGTLVSTCTQ